MPAAASAADVKKPGLMKKLILTTVIAALVLGIAGLGVALFVKKSRADAEAADDESTPVATKVEHRRDRHAPPVFVPMDNFVVNLADHDADRYAQIGVTLEVLDEGHVDEVKAYMPAIRNNVLLLLAHKASADLASADGKSLLAREIRREALRAMGEDVDDSDLKAEEDDGAAAPRARKKKHAVDMAGMPIRSVQFSSFIIQ
jgi:flagellar FliL protein